MSEMWSAEYWAKKGDVDLYMYRKRKGAPQEGEAPMPIFFLVHGSSFSAPTSFDLTVTSGRLIMKAMAAPVAQTAILVSLRVPRTSRPRWW
jgi:hypothetical protein